MGGSCRGGVGNVRVGWGWVMHEWGGSCRGSLGGVFCVM